MKLVVTQIGVSLRDCPAGLFLFGGSLGFRSEYRSDEGHVEAFVLEGGEFFWGGARTQNDREELIVTPVQIEM